MDAVEAAVDVESQDTKPTTRRVLLLGALGGLGALIANSLGHPIQAEAALGDPLRAGRTVSAGTGNTALTTKSTGAALRVVQSGTGRGIQGQTARLPAVDGRASATTGGSRGVQGVVSSPEGIAVSGFSYAKNGDTNGIYGSTESSEGHAVQGDAYATSGQPFGVYGSTVSPDGTGVAGYSLAESGNLGYGVYGDTASSGGVGVVGWATAATGSTIGVSGNVASPDGWAGRFSSDTGNGVYITVPAGKAGLNVVSGTKNAVVSTPSGARLMYSEEATEVLFADHGFGRLANGSASITIDETFAATVDLTRPYHVFLQTYGPSQIYVIDRTERSFTVRSHGAADNHEFSYRILAVRRGYQGHRLEPAPWADADANLSREAGMTTASLAAARGPGASVGRKGPNTGRTPEAI